MQHGPCPIAWILTRQRRAEVGQRVLGEEVLLTRGEELRVFGEVVVDREALDACPARDLGHRRAGRAHFCVKRDRCLDDSAARRLLALRPGLQLVLSLFASHAAQSNGTSGAK